MFVGELVALYVGELVTLFVGKLVALVVGELVALLMQICCTFGAHFVILVVQILSYN